MRKLKHQFERAALLLLLVLIITGGSYAAVAGNGTSSQAVAAPSATPVMMIVTPPAIRLEDKPSQVAEPADTSSSPMACIDAPLGEAEAAALVSACGEYDIDLSLALGLIFVESRFIPDAVSSEGCYGLCQLNPVYFPSDLTPVENIETGMKFLGELLDKYQDVPAALTAYNAGHDTGDRTYANAVLAAAENWR